MSIPSQKGFVLTRRRFDPSQTTKPRNPTIKSKAAFKEEEDTSAAEPTQQQHLEDDRGDRRIEQERHRQGDGGVLVPHPADHAAGGLGARLVLRGGPRGEGGPAAREAEVEGPAHGHARHWVARLVVHLPRLRLETVLLAGICIFYKEIRV